MSTQMLGWDDDASVKQHEAVAKALYSPTKGLEQMRQYYEATMNELTHQNSNKLRDCYQLDAIRDATNLSHANFIASLFHIPLKHRGAQDGITGQELFDMLRTIFAYVSLDLDSTKSFGLRAKARKAALDLGRMYRPVCEAVKEERFHALKEMMGIDLEIMPDYGNEFIRRLLEQGMDIDELVWTVIPLAAETSFQGQGVSLKLYSNTYHMSPSIPLADCKNIERANAGSVPIRPIRKPLARGSEAR